MSLGLIVIGGLVLLVVYMIIAGRAKASDGWCKIGGCESADCDGEVYGGGPCDYR